jgi:Ca2+-binding EF-hand superfamily protein
MTPNRLIAALAVLLIAFGAQAAMQEERAEFDALDKNGDGLLSKGEAKQHKGLDKAFEQADADRNGMISRAEYETVLPQLKRQN